MKVPKIFKRLDVQLSIIIGAIVGLWFASFFGATQLLNKERSEKQLALETERISMTIQGELTQILNDILLDHTAAIKLTLDDLFQTLGLSRIKLSTANGSIFERGDSFVKEAESKVIGNKFDISFDGTSYGTLEFLKSVPNINIQPIGTGWLIGVAVALMAIFIIIRVFINRQIISPLTSVIAQLDPNVGSKELMARSTGSLEIERLMGSVGVMKAALKDYQEKVVVSERQTALGALASQVAHDIRSPLSALAMANDDLAELPEEKRILVRSAMARIHDIANSLIEKQYEAQSDNGSGNSNGTENSSVQLLPSLIDTVISEKRTQFRSRLGLEILSRLEPRAYGLFAEPQPREFKRMLSNLVNNAAEAIQDTGTIEVVLGRSGNQISLSIKDNGKGIPEDKLPLLMQRGASFKEEKGLGFGLSHAKESIEKRKGTISLSSVEGKGTEVSLTVPSAHPPSWFVPEIRIHKDSTVIVLDDDLTIHRIWQRRFENCGVSTDESISVLHFSTVSELEKWHKSQATTHAVLYLIDFELLGQKKNGLEIIESLGIANQSILVTSRFEEKKILEECSRLPVALLPKSM